MESYGGALSSLPSGALHVDGRALWYVVETKRHRERVAQRFLEAASMRTYLPLIRERPRPIVGSDIVPLFPGYIFIEAVLVRDQARIIRTVGVKRLLAAEGVPGTVDPQVIEFLRTREGPDGLVRCEKRPEPGARVEIIKGPFSGLEAVVEESLPGRERVRILLAVLKRQTPVEMPQSWIREQR